MNRRNTDEIRSSTDEIRSNTDEIHTKFHTSGHLKNPRYFMNGPPCTTRRAGRGHGRGRGRGCGRRADVRAAEPERSESSEAKYVVRLEATSPSGNTDEIRTKYGRNTVKHGRNTVKYGQIRTKYTQIRTKYTRNSTHLDT